MIRWVPKKEINEKRVSDLLSSSIESGQFTNYGPNVKLLEEVVRKVLIIDNNKSVVCVSNATHGLWAVISAFEMFYNTKITCATQSMTFPASAQGVLKDTTILDIDSDGGLDLNLVTTEKCIFVTNIFGNLVDIDKYSIWAKENNKLVVFDNAATPISFYKGKNSCNYGNASVISFHHTKPLGFGEGGCIIIDNQYEESLRKIINFGFDSNHKWHRNGSNYKMSDIQASYIIQHLDRIDEIVKKHHELTTYFVSRLPKHIKLFPNASEKPFFSCFCILLKNSSHYLDTLISNGINARIYYEPLISTPVADAFFNDILCIPCTNDMTIIDIDRIIELLYNILSHK